MTNAPGEPKAPDPEQPAAETPQNKAWWLALIGVGVLLVVLGAVWFGFRSHQAPSTAPEAPAQPPKPVQVEVLVRSATDGALEGAHVSVMGEGDARTDNVSDTHGVARLSVPSGALRVEVDRVGYGRALGHAEAPAGQTLQLTVLLEPERVLEGSIIDDLGDPIANASVHVQSLDDLEMRGFDLKSDANGHFKLAGLPRHELSLEIVSEGHEAHERALAEGFDDALIVVLPRQGELSVRVEDSQGDPVNGAEVLLTGTGLWPAEVAHSEAQGEHVFVKLGSGKYYARARRGAEVGLPSLPIDVVPGERARVTLQLVPGAKACGQVVDTSDGHALAGAHVDILELTPGLPPRTLVTDAEGRFDAVGLWPGEARLELSHDGYAQLSLATRLPQDECRTLKLTGAASVQGVVLDERGLPLAHALVSVSTREGLPANLGKSMFSRGLLGVGELGVTQGPVPRIPLTAPSMFAMGALAAESDDGGLFRITGLNAAPLVLSVARAGYAPSTLAIDDLKPHEIREGLRVTLHTAGRIEGRVSDARGRGVSGVYLAARTSDGIEQSALSDGVGDFVIPDVLGDVTVEATPSGYRAVTCHVTVRAGEVTRCVLALDSQLHELAVRVEDERGIPLSGALVTVRGASADRASSQLSRDDGAAVVHELPEPPYLVDVTLPGYLSVHRQPVEAAGRELRIALSRSSTIQGVVLDSLGHPVRTAFVSTDEGDASADSDASGNFTLVGVAPGALTLWAKHKRAGVGQSAEVRARPGDTLSGVRIVLDGRYIPSQQDDKPNVPSAPHMPSNVAQAAPQAAQNVAKTPEKPQVLTLDQRGPKVLVSGVGSGSPGEKAGMRAGDVVLSVDGETVFSAAQARGMLRDPPGTTAAVRVAREDRVLSLRFKRPSL
jgi:hypothetical protein